MKKAERSTSADKRGLVVPAEHAQPRGDSDGGRRLANRKELINERPALVYSKSETVSRAEMTTDCNEPPTLDRPLVLRRSCEARAAKDTPELAKPAPAGASFEARCLRQRAPRDEGVGIAPTPWTPSWQLLLPVRPCD